MSQVKSCDCETCKLTVDLYERDKTNGFRENVSGAFIFARKPCDIVFFESSRSTLESTCENFFKFFSLAEFFFFHTKKTFCIHSSSLEPITP